MKNYRKEIQEKLNKVKKRAFNDSLIKEGKRIHRKLLKRGSNLDFTEQLPELLALKKEELSIVLNQLDNQTISLFKESITNSETYYKEFQEESKFNLFEEIIDRFNKMKRKINLIVDDHLLPEPFEFNNQIRKQISENSFKYVRKNRILL